MKKTHNNNIYNNYIITIIYHNEPPPLFFKKTTRFNHNASAFAQAWIGPQGDHQHHAIAQRLADDTTFLFVKLRGGHG